MEKLGVIKCPSCETQDVRKFSEVPEKEFKCNKCGFEFGKNDVKLPEGDIE